MFKCFGMVDKAIRTRLSNDQTIDHSLASIARYYFILPCFPPTDRTLSVSFDSIRFKALLSRAHLFLFYTWLRPHSLPPFSLLSTVYHYGLSFLLSHFFSFLSLLSLSWTPPELASLSCSHNDNSSKTIVFYFANFFFNSYYSSNSNEGKSKSSTTSCFQKR